MPPTSTPRRRSTRARCSRRCAIFSTTGPCSLRRSCAVADSRCATSALLGPGCTRTGRGRPSHRGRPCGRGWSPTTTRRARTGCPRTTTTPGCPGARRTQWIELVSAPGSTWPPAVDRREKTQVLSAERDRRAIPVLRRQVLALLAELPAGQLGHAGHPDRRARRPAATTRRRAAPTTPWRRPCARPATSGSPGPAAPSARLRDCSWRRPAPTRRVAAPRRTPSPRPSSQRCPRTSTTSLIQADLTIVAPGPLVSHVARSLRLLADVESRGHATVYRISEVVDPARTRRRLGCRARSTACSPRSRALPCPSRWPTSSTTSPRRHGAVRIGNALGYVRCDNPETLGALLADRRLRTLGLSRIADTVLVSQAPAPELIAELRSAGYAPAAESPDGNVVIRRPEDHRIPAPRPAPVTTRRLPEDALVDGRDPHPAGGRPGLERPSRRDRHRPRVVAAVRQPQRGGDRGDAARGDRRQPADVDRLRRHRRHHHAADRRSRSGSMPACSTAFDHRTEQVRTFAVSRVTGWPTWPTAMPP